MFGKAEGSADQPGWAARLLDCLREAASESLAPLSEADLSQGFATLQVASQMIDAQRLRRLSEIDSRKSYAGQGHLSATSWLVGEFRVGGGEAAGAVKMARALGDMPRTAEALALGEVGTSAVRVLVSAREAAPQAFREAEGTLVSAARVHTVDGLSRVAGAWKHRVDSEAALKEWNHMRERRSLSIGSCASGMVRIHGDLDPETGEVVMTALKAVTDASLRARGSLPDPRTAPQRTADALGEISRAYLDCSDRAVVGQERPHLTVTVDVEALKGGAGRSELEHGGPVHPEVARRLACDASLTRVLTAGRSEPLDVGRRTRMVPEAIRRAVVVRDGGCSFPQCGRPPGWCDAHHIRHWADGGPTALSNLLLMCRPHHGLMHEGGFTVEMIDGHPMFRTPDGAVIENRAPPTLQFPA